ncbi:putative tetratricopeptide-like helical domain superfamily, malT-like TPR region [Helianthus annuus]|nr:putative tetratricopeptide-like helical domain superfamily, malT-like TPR region [Helianthus annuus]KAJ0639762.1 putative tetratricopeptide-like helical domain superfamily, malT-like TPR region [Helianthus annuus]
MPGLVLDEIHEDKVIDEMPENGNLPKTNDNLDSSKSPDNVATGNSVSVVVEPSIDQLYDNVCEMQSSDQSLSRLSYGSDGEESRIDSELRHLVGGEMKEVEIIQQDEEISSFEEKQESSKSHSSKKSKKASELESEVNSESISKNKYLQKGIKKPVVGDKNVNLGPHLLKQARDLLSSGDNPRKALDLALRAAKSFEKSTNGNPGLDAVMCMHVTAAIYCNLGQYGEAIQILENSVRILVNEESQDHALAKFAGYMQLGDTYSMLGQLENSLQCYKSGLDLQKKILGETDPRVGETCRYLAEAHVQALQFDEAEKLCQTALEIHKENGLPASLEEAADRKLMGLICETKGDHEAALEHLVLASMAMMANGHENEVCSVDVSIGDTYLSLSRFDEAIHAYQKALTALKSSKGENHPAVASVYVRLADLHNKIGKIRDSKSYCENALRIYEKPAPGIPQEEIACGFTDISAIYESMNELDYALKLLHKALKIYNDVPGQQNTVAGIEAQMGVMYYVLGKYSESYNSFKSAILKLRASGEKKNMFFGIALNQMGLTCVQRYAINEALDLFEEARSILEHECGSYHPDTLAVYSNLAGTYDAVGRLDDAIALLERIVVIREEKLGTAHPDVDDEKRRLAELLKEAGKVRTKKNRSLEHLLDSSHGSTINNGATLTVTD